MARSKAQSLFRIEKHPTFFGMHVGSNKSMGIGALLILTGILAPAGMILWLFGGHHRAKKTTPHKKHKKR